MKRKFTTATKPFNKHATSLSLLSKTNPEVFIKICSTLSPRDLFSLSQVSNHLRSFLCSQDSQTAQSIWRKSRITHLYYPKLPPPDDMSERHYILLTYLAVKCQFCRHPRKQSKVYWAFGVRCCMDCFHQRTVSEYSLLTRYKIPKESLSGLSYTSPCNYKIYWSESVAQAQRDYSSAIESNSLKEYLYLQMKLRISFMQQIKSYELEYRSELIRWNLHNNTIIEDIRLRSSCMAEEIARDMELDTRKLIDLGVYCYPIELNSTNNSTIKGMGDDCSEIDECDVQNFFISDEQWRKWRKEVESKCKMVKKRSSGWFNRLSIISVKS